MRSSSTRLRTSAALATSSLALLFALSGSAMAGENGQGDDHRSDRSAPSKTAPITETEDTDAAATDEPGTGPTADNVTDEGDNQHPSGNDRSVENGGSGNQGKSQSDPDGATNGGADKPGMAGGDDLNDQDGNNGCGNDDDFEDDNNGNCGPKVRTTTPPPPPPVVIGTVVEKCPEGQTMPAGGTAPKDCKVPEVTVSAGTIAPAAVLGTQLQSDAPATLAATTADMPTQVLGVVVERPATGAPAVLGATAVRGAALARTGFGMTLLVVVGLALLLAGFGLKRAGRTTA